jgi:hypothetical protein
MILDASQRGRCLEMGLHLLNQKQNEHVEVHEVKGFASQDVMSAMKEIEAISKGTRAKQPLFSLSLSPPAHENVRVEVFEGAIARIEEANGLTGQPRVVVFHEKQGRRHCHCVWSRIDAESMTAIPMSHFKFKLREVSRDLYLENGWRMPRGLMNSAERDPRTFTVEQWHQAKRLNRDAQELRGIMQECYAVSDSGQSFARALEERGLYLAKGDHRAYVALTYEGEALSVARYTGRNSKMVAVKLGSMDNLRSVEETRAYVANIIGPRLRAFREEANSANAENMAALERERQAMKQRHVADRARADSELKTRQEAETRIRAERIRTGLRGLIDRLTGQRARVSRQNELEAEMAVLRDREQRQLVVAAQLSERRLLQDRILQERQRHSERLVELHRDLCRQGQQQEPEPVPAPMRQLPPVPADRLAERFAQIAERQRERLRQAPARESWRGYSLER